MELYSKHKNIPHKNIQLNFSKAVSQLSGERMALFTKAAGAIEQLCIQTATITSFDRNLTSHPQYELKTCYEYKCKTMELLAKKQRQKIFGKELGL